MKEGRGQEQMSQNKFLVLVLCRALESSNPFSSRHLSCDVCLDVRGEIFRTVLCCIVY